MRPTFMGFETTKRGLTINQKGLDIVGHNISNIGVTGYTRQRVDQVSLSGCGVSGRVYTNRSLLAGQGADVNGIAQLRDPYLDKRFRQENSDMTFYSKTSEIMTDIETALDEYDSSGIKDAIAKFSNALSALTGNGINATNANVVRTSAKSITQVLQQFDVKLNNIISQQQYDAEINVDSVNSILQRLANLNDSIANDTRLIQSSRVTETYYGPNELLDERNLLLDQLSQYGDIQVEVKSDNSVEVKMANHTVVDGKYHETLNMTTDRDANTIALSWQSTGESFAPTSGSLLASMNMINGRGPQALGDENYERGIPYYKDQLDTFAKTFANVFNNIVPEFDENGDPKLDPVNGDVIYKQLFTFDQTKEEGASSIQITDKWNEAADFLLTPKNSDGVYDNTYYLKMVEQLDADISFGNGFTGRFEDYVKDYNTTLGEDKTFHDSRLSASMAIAESVLDSIQQVSGVSMDEEGAEMMTYSKAYNAISRVMTAMDEALDVLINNTGLVGR